MKVNIIKFFCLLISLSSFITPSYGGSLLFSKLFSQKTLYIEKVIDGDTIILSDGRYIRFIGIDTPEIRKKVNGQWVYVWEPFSKEALEFCIKILTGKKIKLEYDSEIKDVYNRDLCYVFANDIFVNEAILREGLAFPYLTNKLKYYRRLRNAFFEAVKQKKNLYKINLSYERDLKKFLSKHVFFEGKVNNFYSSDKLSQIIFDRLIVETEGLNKKIKKGDYLYVYGKLIQKQGRFVLLADRKKVFYFD